MHKKRSKRLDGEQGAARAADACAPAESLGRPFVSCGTDLTLSRTNSTAKAISKRTKSENRLSMAAPQGALQGVEHSGAAILPHFGARIARK
ncbi:MAG TPA: hypothetical protein VM755_21705 [Stellaceae bacterium]|nr:hypothetical protein [Stellaceae bacterium]